MKKILLSIIIGTMSFVLMSQNLEHSWCLFPDYSDDVLSFSNLIEADDGNYIVSMYDYSNYFKSPKDATIIKLNSDGVIINEIDVNIDDAYILNEIVLDVWNDTVNVFHALHRRTS